MQTQIVPYEEKYHDKLVDIWHRAVCQTHTFLAEDDIQFYHHMVQNGALKEVELWVELHEDQEPLGFIGLDGTRIEMLFVDPKYHGQGIGSHLVKHAGELKGNKLQVDVNEQNEQAYAFYKRYNCVLIGRSELDGSGKPFPLLHLELTL